MNGAKRRSGTAYTDVGFGGTEKHRRSVNQYQSEANEIISLPRLVSAPNSSYLGSLRTIGLIGAASTYGHEAEAKAHTLT